jgi:hypothetical protein
MKHGNNHAPSVSVTKRVAFAVIPTLLAIWAVLPRFAIATRSDQRAESGVAERGREQQPDSVPQTVHVTGRVVNPQGQPVGGATLHLHFDSGNAPGPEPATGPARATTRADGRFEFTALTSELATARSRRRGVPGPLLAAFANGFGPAWTDDLMIGEPDGVVIELVDDDVPITGRLVDLEGRPAQGITVRVLQLDATPNDLSPWLEDIQKEPDGFLPFNHFTKPLPVGLSSLIQPVTTVADGTFRLSGCGRERLVSLLIEGPRFETRVVKVMTRRGPSASVRFRHPDATGHLKNYEITIHPAEFTAVAAPTRAVEGIVTDASDGRPLQNVTIRAELTSRNGSIDPYPLFDWPGMFIRATTDTRGHYRLTGLPMRDAVGLKASPAESQPSRSASREFANPPGFEPTRCDVALQRGVLVRGQLTDRSTGKPISGTVEYRPAVNNANVLSHRDLASLEPVAVPKDGRFTLVALAGPGLVAATSASDRFVTADVVQPSNPHPFPNVGGSLSPRQCHAFEAISPANPADEYQCDLSLAPGPEPTVTILDSEGNPLKGATVSGIPPADVAREGWWQSRQKAVFHVSGLTDHRIRRIFVHHVERRLAGTLAVRDADPSPLVTRLRPWGVVTGRLVDRAGQPRPGVTLSYHETIAGKTPFPRHIPRDVTTDADGNFAFEGLAPEVEYIIRIATAGTIAPSARVGEAHSLEPGEPKSLGDVQEVAP